MAYTEEMIDDPQTVPADDTGAVETSASDEKPVAGAQEPPDISKMNVAELEAYATKLGDQLSGMETESTPTTEKPAAAEKKPAGTPDITSPKWAYEFEIDGHSYRFKDDKGLQKSFESAQRYIAKLKTQAQSASTLQKQLEQTTSKISEYEATIQQLRAGAQRVAAGQSPTQAQASAMANANLKPGDTSGVIAQKIADFEAQFGEIRQTNEELRSQLSKVLEEANRKTRDTSLKNLYREVGDFQKNHPDLGTQKPFAEIDDLVEEHGDDGAQSMVDSSDWQAYTTLRELIEMQKKDRAGRFDLDRKNFEDFEEAFLLHQKRAGKLDNQLIAARRAGQAAAVAALEKRGNSATDIPPRRGATGREGRIGAERMQQLVRMDPKEVMKDPKLREEFVRLEKQLEAGDLGADD